MHNGGHNYQSQVAPTNYVPGSQTGYYGAPGGFHQQPQTSVYGATGMHSGH